MEKTLLKFLIREQSTRQKVQRLKMINFNARSSITVKPLSDKNPRQAPLLLYQYFEREKEFVQ